MKILLVHNFYQSSSPSGEDAVFRNGHELKKKLDEAGQLHYETLNKKVYETVLNVTI